MGACPKPGKDILKRSPYKSRTAKLEFGHKMGTMKAHTELKDLTDMGAKLLILWCPEPDSNRHGPFGPRDFKSRVSTKFHHPGVNHFNNLHYSRGQAVALVATPLPF